MQGVTVTVEEFAKALSLGIEFPGCGDLVLMEGDVNRPGLQLTGFFEHYAHQRVQLIGNAEMHYMLQAEPEMLRANIRKMMDYHIPCVVFSRSHKMSMVLEEAQNRNIPVFCSTKQTSQLNHMISNYVDRKLAPTITRHGVLLDIYGIGVMLSGESGTGKSETALELIKRGHRLVADDVLEIRRVTESRLSGTAPALTRHLLEIRGIGIIDVRYMYGVGAVIHEKSIDLIIEMEMWQENKSYERLGLDEEYDIILDVKIPRILIPVRPGRNLAIIAEVAARNYRLKKLGYNAAKEFDKRWMEELHQ